MTELHLRVQTVLDELIADGTERLSFSTGKALAATIAHLLVADASPRTASRRASRRPYASPTSSPAACAPCPQALALALAASNGARSKMNRL